MIQSDGFYGAQDTNKPALFNFLNHFNRIKWPSSVGMFQSEQVHTNSCLQIIKRSQQNPHSAAKYTFSLHADVVGERRRLARPLTTSRPLPASCVL